MHPVFHGPACRSAESDRVYNAALRALGAGPVAFGEVHTRELARCVIGRLISAGRVLRLFLEVRDWHTSSGEDAGPYLRHFVRQASPTAGDSAVLRSIIDRLQYMEGTTTGIRGVANPVPLQTLVAYAVDTGVRVYFYDEGATSPADFELMARDRAKRRTEQIRFNEASAHAATAVGIGERNVASAALFSATPDHAAPGTVILGGAAHFNRERSNGLDLLSLLRVRAYFDCSGQ